MTTHRFFIKELFVGEEITITEPILINQWQKVLRFKAGDSLNLIDLNGREAVGVIQSLSKTAGVIKISSFLPTSLPLKPVNLGLAILKKENFELVVQKATEIGVTSITPLLTDRTVKLGLNSERLERIITEASEQSGRQFKPLITEVVSLKDYLNNLPTGITLACSLNGKDEKTGTAGKNLNLLIGPEGGWSESEEKELVDKGVILKSLGKQVLRAETAAITASYLAVHDLL